jgi:hypothetical protein
MSRDHEFQEICDKAFTRNAEHEEEVFETSSGSSRTAEKMARTGTVN